MSHGKSAHTKLIRLGQIRRIYMEIKGIKLSFS
jgi:hypothetical protein